MMLNKTSQTNKKAQHGRKENFFFRLRERGKKIKPINHCLMRQSYPYFCRCSPASTEVRESPSSEKMLHLEERLQDTGCPHLCSCAATSTGRFLSLVSVQITSAVHALLLIRMVWLLFICMDSIIQFFSSSWSVAHSQLGSQELLH